jgi:hypothetical protein
LGVIDAYNGIAGVITLFSDKAVLETEEEFPWYCTQMRYVGIRFFLESFERKELE